MFKPLQIATSAPTDTLYIIFFNETSKQPNLQYDVNSINVLDYNYFSLLVPERTCAAGHTLTLYIFRDLKMIKRVKELPLPKKVPNVIELTCKVKSSERADQGFAEITLEPQGKDLELWKEIIGQSEHKQEVVSQLFDKYKS